MKNDTVFLGGTCAGTQWREELIPMLENEYFNPVVTDWTEACIRTEEKAKKDAYIHLYVLTPQMEGVYSVAEMMHDSIKEKKYDDMFTIVCVLEEYDGKTFTKGQMKSIKASVNLAVDQGDARSVESLEEVARICNKIHEYNTFKSADALSEAIQAWTYEAGECFFDYFDSNIHTVTLMSYAFGRGDITWIQYEKFCNKFNGVSYGKPGFIDIMTGEEDFGIIQPSDELDDDDKIYFAAIDWFAEWCMVNPTYMRRITRFLIEAVTYVKVEKA